MNTSMTITKMNTFPVATRSCSLQTWGTRSTSWVHRHPTKIDLSKMVYFFRWTFFVLFSKLLLGYLKFSMFWGAFSQNIVSLSCCVFVFLFLLCFLLCSFANAEVCCWCFTFVSFKLLLFSFLVFFVHVFLFFSEKFFFFQCFLNWFCVLSGVFWDIVFFWNICFQKCCDFHFNCKLDCVHAE